MRKAITLLIALASIYWIINGFSLGIWVNRGPGAGLFPVIGGLLTFGCILADYFRSRQCPAVKLSLKLLEMPVAVLLTVGLMYLVGMIVSLFLFLIAWLVFIEKYPWRKSLTISLCVMATIYGVFNLWLAVPFFKGLLNWI